MDVETSFAQGPALVDVSHVSKRFSRDLRQSLKYAAVDIGRELLMRGDAEDSLTLRSGEFAALDDISFELRRGESLAIIGENGAGKSTLLKVLYGLIKPDAGEVRLRGRVAALIELGTGFDPVLTGRENIAVNAALLGHSDRSLAQLTHRIIEFAELEDVIDTPVRYYSTGMSARLAFAVAANLEADVLMVDEVLAVGDLGFQRKCAVHIQQYLVRGGALIFVSHNPFQVQTLCQRGILLDHGRCTFAGSSTEAVARYFAEQHATSADSRATVIADASRPIAIEAVRVEPVAAPSVRSGEPVRLVVVYRSVARLEVLWGFTIWTGDHWVCITGDVNTEPSWLIQGQDVLSCLIPRLPLVAGAYTIRVGILEADTLQPLALLGWEDAPVPLQVEAAPSLFANARNQIEQLVTLDVDWS